jgi:hypothetical protein
MSMIARMATLEDISAISALHRQPIERWQRLNATGQVEDLPYEQLSIYERWLHGGAWMSIETSAVWLNHLLANDIVAMVCANEGQILGYLEAYPGHEPAPYGDHLYLHSMVTAAESETAAHAAAIEETLLAGLIAAGRPFGRLLASVADYDEAHAVRLARLGFTAIEGTTTVRLYSVPARTGLAFYQATRPGPLPAKTIEGWHMLLGRTGSARQHWGAVWPVLWAGVPQIQELRVDRIRLSAAGQEAYIVIQQKLYDPRGADVYCWSSKPLSRQLVIALGDWAHREGYRALNMAMTEDAAALFGSDLMQAAPYAFSVMARELKPGT